MEQLLPFFTEFGLPGIAIGYLLWSNSKKEDRIVALTDKLVEKNEADVKRFTDTTLTLERILAAVQGGAK